MRVDLVPIIIATGSRNKEQRQYIDLSTVLGLRKSGWLIEVNRILVEDHHGIFHDDDDDGHQGMQR